MFHSRAGRREYVSILMRKEGVRMVKEWLTRRVRRAKEVTNKGAQRGRRNSYRQVYINEEGERIRMVKEGLTMRVRRA